MLNIFNLFINKILTFGNLKISEIPRKYYAELLTGLEKLKRIDTVFFPEFTELASRFEGKLIIDDTIIPSMDLKIILENIKTLRLVVTRMVLKLLLFLWETNNIRIPIVFALWGKESNSINDLALAGLSRIRNEFKLKPKVVLADGAFSIDKLVKRNNRLWLVICNEVEVRQET